MTEHPVLPPAPPRKRPSAAEMADTIGGGVRGGVSVFWLAKAFDMSVSSVRMKLADCPPMVRKGGGYLYSLPQAASYLVKPRIDIHEYVGALKPADLPPALQPAYWDAKLKRQKFEQQAAELWRTEDVSAAFAEIFKLIKFSLQLWPDTVERSTGLTEAQREILIGLCDALQDEIYAAVKDLAGRQATPNSLERDRQESQRVSGADEEEWMPDVL